MAKKLSATIRSRPTKKRMPVQGAAPRRMLVELETLVLDEQMQPRVAMDISLIEAYSEQMSAVKGGYVACEEEGRNWPEIEIVEDPDAGTRWLVDGFHRVLAAKRAGVTSFQANVYRGGFRDALARSLKANAYHGARRTEADFEHALKRALEDEEWAVLGTRELGKLLGCSHQKISRWRRRLEASGDVEAVTQRVGQDGKTYQVQETRTSRPTSKHRPWTSHKRVERQDRLEAAGQNLLLELSSEQAPMEELRGLAAELSPEGSIAVAFPSQGSPMGAMRLAVELGEHPTLSTPKWYSSSDWVVLVFAHMERQAPLPEQGKLTFPQLIKSLGDLTYVEL